MPLDRYNIFAPADAVIKFHGHSIETKVSDHFSTLLLAFEHLEFFSLDKYIKSEDGNKVLQDKKAVLGHLLALSKTLLKAHKAGIYHRHINYDAIRISNDGSAWKFTPFGATYALQSSSSAYPPKSYASFLPPEHHLSGVSNPWKADVFAITILIQILMLDQKTLDL